jgi:hypothetical protein
MLVPSLVVIVLMKFFPGVGCVGAVAPTAMEGIEKPVMGKASAADAAAMPPRNARLAGSISASGSLLDIRTLLMRGLKTPRVMHGGAVLESQRNVQMTW